jgi:alpha-L-rhamnosidase
VMAPPPKPARLRCAHLVNPLGIAPDRVRFSWELEGTEGDCAQAAFHIQVFPNEGMRSEQRQPYWDSGEVASAETADIPYTGRQLMRGGRYRWWIRVRDGQGRRSDWSDQATFEVELDQADGWRAAWISRGRVRESVTPPSGAGPVDPVANALAPAPYLRRSFAVDGPVSSARLYITALGLYEARLNGQRVGDACLAPGWTDYGKRVLYQTYDVTAMLGQGENVLGAVLADGWYSGFFGFDAKRAGSHYGTAPELLAQLVITFADGSQQRIVTDEHWRAGTGAIRHADLLMGEKQDLRLEPAGWDAPGFNADDWPAVGRRDRDDRPLVADPGPPVRVTEEIMPAGITRDSRGRQIVDFGQNLPGWVRLHVAAPAGTAIRIRHGEVLSADGSLYTENLRTARQTDEYVTGDGDSVLEPRFTLHGFRYAEITGYPGDLDPADAVAVVVHSDIEASGCFSSSERWLDQLFNVIDWGQRGNFVSVPTDCPQRDERLGWLGDAQIFARTACYNRDVASFFAKWIDDVADAQLPSGAFTDVAPRLTFTRPAAPAWGDAGVIVPWTVWKMYGDTAILRRHFGAMTRWMDFIERANPDYLRTRELGNSYNDWLAPGDDNTPRELLATAYWAHDAALMAEIAEAAGRPGEAAGYRALQAKIRLAFADAFVRGDGRIASGAQTAYVLGLHMGLIPDELSGAAAEQLVAAIRDADWHLTTGFVGVGYLLPVLSANGHDDVAYRLLVQRTRPSWRYMLDNGATTIWERWDGRTGERGFQSPQMNSFNHYSLGSVGEWLYRFVLGIDQQPGTAGFGRLLLRPHPGGELSWARGSYRSVRGLIGTGWEHSGDQFTFRVELPPNVTASVRVPSGHAAGVRDQDGSRPKALASYPGAAGIQEAVFEVGSGTHQFSGRRTLSDRRVADVAGGGVRCRKREESLTLKLEGVSVGRGQRTEELDSERRGVAGPADPPHPGDKTVGQHGPREDAVLGENPLAGLVADDPGPVGVRKDQVVELRDQPNRCVGVRRRPRRVGQVEELGTRRIAERPEPGPQPLRHLA